MPVPIKPSRNQVDSSSDTSNYYSFDVDALAKTIGDIETRASISKQAEASDEEADILFELWQKSEIIKDAENTSDRRYACPKTFPKDSLTRLKASNLIAGEDTIRFLPRAIGVIRTMVLSENNSFREKSQKKPYSVILAERKHSISAPRLALGGAQAETISQDSCAMAKTAGININLPPEKTPRSTTEYIRSDRLINYRSTGTSGTPSNKEYVVRVFDYGDGTYSTVGFNGKVGRGLSVQPKYLGPSINMAQMVADSLVREKIHNGYDREVDINMDDYSRYQGLTRRISESQAPGRPATRYHNTPISTPVARPIQEPVDISTQPSVEPSVEPSVQTPSRTTKAVPKTNEAPETTPVSETRIKLSDAEIAKILEEIYEKEE